MLQRILGSHSQILTHPEPHILTPLAFQGYYHEVDKAKYNHKVAAKAFKEFVDFLPHKEEDYLHACREYCNVLYTNALVGTGRTYFLDKTPNYADAILPFIDKLLPKAKIIVLTRHPLAVISSHANTIEGGDYDLMYYNRDILGDFIPPISEFMRSSKHNYLSVRYEDLVLEPDFYIARIFDYLGLGYEDSCIDYGKHNHINKTYGDPKIQNNSRPVAGSIDSWVCDLNGRPDRIRLCKLMIRKISDRDMDVYGYPKKDLFRLLDVEASTKKCDEKKNIRPFMHFILPSAWRIFRFLQSQAHKPVLRRAIVSVGKVCDALTK